MGLDNIEFREIATKMFLQENQYQLARKLNRKKFVGRNAMGVGGTYGAGVVTVVAGIHKKSFGLEL